MKIKIQKQNSPIDFLIDSLIIKQSVITFNSPIDSQFAWSWLCENGLLEFINKQSSYHKSDRIYNLILSLCCVKKISLNGSNLFIDYSSFYVVPAIILNGNTSKGMEQFERAVYFMHPCIAIIEYGESNNDYYNSLINWKNKNKFHGDYFRHNCKYLQNRKIVKIGNTLLKISVMEFTFMTSFKDEQLFRREVAITTNKLIIGSNSEYQKIKTIYKYIVNNVSYDYSFSNYSAYHALIKRNAVCEGISLLLYSMLRQADISARIVYGKGKNDGHSWNIVLINGVWYNLDATWDLGKPEFMWEYFLCGNNTFRNHTIDASFLNDLKRDNIKISDSNCTIC